MNILTIEDIQKGLDSVFLPLEPMLTGFRLLPSKMSYKDINEVESMLSVSFPDSFRKILLEYDLGNLTIGPIAFCATGDYKNELINLNSDIEKISLINNLIVIAISDPYTILIDINNGKIVALDPELNLSEKVTIADNFEKFLLGIGTVFLLRNEDHDKEKLAHFVHDSVNSESLRFWMFLSN